MKKYYLLLAILALGIGIACLLPEPITVSVAVEWSHNSTLREVESAIINSMAGMFRVYVAEEGGHEIRLNACLDEETYRIVVSSDLFESAVYRVPASYPEIAADITKARVNLLFPGRSGEWRRSRADKLDQLIDIMPRIEARSGLREILVDLRDLRGAGVSALTVESEVARYLYESSLDQQYLDIATVAYAEALRVSPNDPRVLAAGVRLARAEGQKNASEIHLKHFRRLYPTSHALAMLAGNYELATSLGHRYGEIETARRAMELQGSSSLRQIEALRPGVDSRFLRAQWELLFGDPHYGLAMMRKLCRDTDDLLPHIVEWKLAALQLAERYQEAAHGYMALPHDRGSVWLGECLYGYALQRLDAQPLDTKYKKYLSLADRCFARAAAGTGRTATIAKAWLGDESALDELAQPSTVWELWDCWRVKTLLGQRNPDERRQLEKLGISPCWFALSP